MFIFTAILAVISMILSAVAAVVVSTCYWVTPILNSNGIALMSDICFGSFFASVIFLILSEIFWRRENFWDWRIRALAPTLNNLVRVYNATGWEDLSYNLPALKLGEHYHDIRFEMEGEKYFLAFHEDAQWHRFASASRDENAAWFVNRVYKNLTK